MVMCLDSTPYYASVTLSLCHYIVQHLYRHLSVIKGREKALHQQSSPEVAARGTSTAALRATLREGECNTILPFCLIKWVFF